MRAREILAVCVAGCVIATLGCGDDSAGGGTAGVLGAGTGGTSATGGTGGAGAAGAGGAGAGASGTGGGMLGPTSSIRVVNLVPDVTFDAWGPDLDRKPVRLAEGITYAAASEYFEAPVNPISMEPIFVLWRSGDVPAEGSMFSMLLDDTHERVRIEVRELEAPGERATIIVEPVDPVEEDPTAHLQYETLDETELNRGDAAQLNLHITYHLFGIGDGIVDSLAIEGEACFHGGSTSVAQVFSIPAGASTLAVYDIQTTSACSQSDPLATLPIEGDPGDNLLITLYREGNDVKMFSAPIE